MGCTPEPLIAAGFTSVAIAISLWGAHRVALYCAIEPRAVPMLLALGVPMLAQTPITLALIVLIGDDYMDQLVTRSCAYPWSVGTMFAGAAAWGIVLLILRRRLLPRTDRR